MLACVKHIRKILYWRKFFIFCQPYFSIFFFSRGLFAACDLSVFLVVGKLHDSEGPVIFMQI